MLSSIDKQVKQARRNGEPLDAASWAYEEGFLLSYNDMGKIINYITELRAALRAFINETTPEFAAANGFSNAREKARNAIKNRN